MHSISLHSISRARAKSVVVQVDYKTFRRAAVARQALYCCPALQMMCFCRGRHSNSEFGGMRRGLTLPFCCVVRGSDAKVACGDGKKCNIRDETEREHCGKGVAFFRHHFLTVSADMLAVTCSLSSQRHMTAGGA